jgi:hypothetical protein
VTRRPLRLARPDADRRNLRCGSAARCVTLAARAGWPGFACDGCPGEPLTPDQHRGELEGLAALVEVVAGELPRRALLRHLGQRSGGR